MDFKVTVLGSNSAVPAYNRKPTAQVIHFDDDLFLIDCGEGTQMQMKIFGIKHSKISKIFISHLHGDHFFGLVGLLSSMHLMGRVKPLDLYAPKRLQEILDLQFEVSLTELRYPLCFHALEEYNIPLLDTDQLNVVTLEMMHSIPCYGFKLEHKGLEKTYAFCSDTAYQEALIPKVEGVDLLYHEATFAKKEETRALPTFHSTTEQAATFAKKANVKKLMIGHYSARYRNLEPLLDECTPIFENTVLAIDGETYDV